MSLILYQYNVKTAYFQCRPQTVNVLCVTQDEYTSFEAGLYSPSCSHSLSLSTPVISNYKSNK